VDKIETNEDLKVTKHLRKEIIKVAIISIIILMIPLFLKLTPLGKYTEFSQWKTIKENLHSNQYMISIIYCLVGSILVSVGFSRLVLSAVGGLLFGAFLGGIFSLLATILGSLITFGFARKTGQAKIQTLMGTRLQKMNNLFSKHSFMAALVIRLCPVGNNYITNLAAGVTSVKLSPFILGSVLGFAPMAFISSLIGSGVSELSHIKISASAILFVLMTAVFLFIYKKFSLAREATKNIDE